MTASSIKIQARSVFQRVMPRKSPQNHARKLKFRTLGAPSYVRWFSSAILGATPTGSLPAKPNLLHSSTKDAQVILDGRLKPSSFPLTFTFEVTRMCKRGCRTTFLMIFFSFFRRQRTQRHLRRPGIRLSGLPLVSNQKVSRRPNSI